MIVENIILLFLQVCLLISTIIIGILCINQRLTEHNLSVFTRMELIQNRVSAPNHASLYDLEIIKMPNFTSGKIFGGEKKQKLTLYK